MGYENYITTSINIKMENNFFFKDGKWILYYHYEYSKLSGKPFGTKNYNL